MSRTSCRPSADHAVEVIAVFDSRENYYRDADSAATAILDATNYEIHVRRPTDDGTGFLYFPLAITRYTTDGTPGGDITEEALTVFRGLPDPPEHPTGGRIVPSEITEDDQIRLDEWRRRLDDWRAESVAVIAAKLALR